MVYISPALKRIVENQLEERSARAPDQSREERPITTVNLKALQNLQFRATVEGHSFILDERESAGGNDAGPAPMRYYAAGIMGSDHVWIVKTAALRDLPLDRLEGELALYGRKIVYTVSIDSPNSDDQVRDLIDQVRSGRGSLSTMAGGRRVEFTLRHNGETIMEKTYGE
ncbi:MAG: hypothetical protein A3F84_07165 [Candidatus Handelsmanbacteria bacterium RIFCSPLOWO2_12_FULL_64_10]|uniref:Uncharacterized protein n=1 Tax=Handelsmanbacteria sp. (strain RIFCSPLOWO2_12_FULL_64_10) TaxID=1817868 RepID=A0A1F6C6G2_HANXR|nr:MAG: hypothetical protein A3F84_07165 [Candidatus Handelsmanbacteria bacterium RIFCSPLOWO2_12_FULL_64_10]